MKIFRGLSIPHLQSASLDQLLSLIDHAKDEDRNLMAECGVVKAIVALIIKCFKERKTTFLEEALRIITTIWIPANVSSEVRAIVADNIDLIDAITWVLLLDQDEIVERKTLAVKLIKELVKVAGSSLVERFKLDFFKGVVGILLDYHHSDNNNNNNNNNNNTNNNNNDNNENINVGPVKAALRVLLEVCKHGRNRHRIIDANTIFHLIELELELGLAQPDKIKKVSELVFCLLAQLCSCADGRAQFLAHSGGIAVVSKRILRVSAVVDDRAVHIFGLISKFSGTKEVLHEMLKVGAVSKLCMVLQADSAKYLKDKVREILRMHSHVWNNSPCVQVYLLTRYPMLQF
ncbi:hypothetical protein SOVF_063010 [Spinacia oleracea]|nr:hypothetical protein SOVF_063010 [Spinacia oleracea]